MEIGLTSWNWLQEPMFGVGLGQHEFRVERPFRGEAAMEENAYQELQALADELGVTLSRHREADGGTTVAARKGDVGRTVMSPEDIRYVARGPGRS